MHTEVLGWLARPGVLPLDPKRIVEFGSRNVNGSPRILFDSTIPYTGIDLVPGEGVDVVGDVADYPDKFPGADLVICTEVLEHADNAEEVVTAAHRLLWPGGRLVLTMAGPERAPHSGQDGGELREGEFYRNVDLETLRGWLQDAGFTYAELGYARDRQDLYGWALA